MLLGELVFSNSDAVLSATDARPAKDATFSVNVTQISGTSPSLAIAIEHKNSDEDTWSTVDSFTAITAKGVYTKAVTGLKEQVRLKLTMSGTNAWARVFTYPAVA